MKIHIFFSLLKMTLCQERYFFAKMIFGDHYWRNVVAARLHLKFPLDVWKLLWVLPETVFDSFASFLTATLHHLLYTHVCEWWWRRLRSFGNSNWVWICMFHARLSFVFEFWTHRNTNIYVWNSHHSSWIYNWHKSWRILGPIFKELFGTAWPFLETSLQNLRRNSSLFLQQQLLDELFSWTKWFSTSSKLTKEY